MNDLARDPKQIGNFVQRARKKQALSQKQLADKVGLRQATISLIESGSGGAKIETLLSILASLDLEFRDIELREDNAEDSDRNIDQEDAVP